MIAEVGDGDPAIHNTRRFVTSEATISGERVRAGETILVMLAGANPEMGVSWSFGHGQHACPGRTLALTIAEEAIAALIRTGRLPRVLTEPITYRLSTNARIPHFDRLNGATR